MSDNNNKTNQNPNEQTDSELQQRLQRMLTDLQLDDAPAGGAVVVYQDGKCIAQASVGLARADLSWSPDTLSLNFSTGKGVLATLVHVLVAQQLLAYDEPIASYWPAFAAQHKGDITLRHVMSHQANLFSIQSIDADSKELLDWQLMLSKIAAMSVTAPEDAELYDSAYSALVYGWVLGGVIEAVTELSLAEALHHYLTEPLGIADSCYFGVPAGKVDQVAMLAKNFAGSNEHSSELGSRRHKPTIKADSAETLKTYANLPSYGCWQQHTLENKETTSTIQGDEQNNLPTLDTARINNLYFNTSKLNLRNYKAALIPANKQPIDYYQRETLQAAIPAANGVASAQALATIYAMLANGGQWQGRTLIDSATFEALAKPQVTGLDAVMPSNMDWRLGYHRLLSICADTQASFGHMGYNGSVAWCDPARQLSFAFIHNFDTTMLNDVRQFALTEAVFDLLDNKILAP
ncbi:serine hydrolase domain-containing protein [Psychrobacter immobilis]|uniref:serine hydrolase domain-containing protein n=1 Tax=Psychrobacter immobilis TaxID=498 RepID=UPI0019180CCE|nr:serine hydrolase domain-containing protein [Psychrobacter immobilis]